MESSHDPIKQLKFLKQVLSEDKKPIAFFLGAGCPFGIKNSQNQPLIPDIDNLTKHINTSLSTNTCYKNLIEEINKTGIAKPNIEDILTFVRSLLNVSKGGTVRGLIEDDLTKIDKDICKEIFNKVNILLPDKNTPYHKFVKWINSIDRDKPIEIFTSNYDLLFEQALEDISVPYYDGFVGSKFPFFDLKTVENINNTIPKHWTRLWKLHGSINWYLNEESQIYRSTELKKDSSYLIYPSHLKYVQSRKTPFLALFDRLNKFISQSSSVILIIGYSFNDEHINDTIINALKSNPSSTAITFLFGNLNETKYQNLYEIAKKRANLSVIASDKAIIGTVECKWKVNNKEELKNYSFLFKLSNENDTEFKIGDINILGNFFESITGKELNYEK